MLRVGLTGELGSGKSTVAHMLAQHGAVVLSSDEMGRAMMQPGHTAFDQIVERFGRNILNPDGTLNRHALAKIAFDPQSPRIEELNAIIHPAVISAQAEQITELARTQPHAIVVIESALIFSTKHSPGNAWRSRFDRIVIVDAPDELKIARFIARTASGRILSTDEETDLRSDAQQRLNAQKLPEPNDSKLIRIENNDAIDELRSKVNTLWQLLISLEQELATS